MINTSAYDTIALSSLPSEQTLLGEVKKGLTFDNKFVTVRINPYAAPFDLKVVDGVSDHHKPIPNFQFPLIEDTFLPQKKLVYIDLRPAGNSSHGTFQVTANGASEFRVRTKLGILNYLWAMGQHEQMLKLSDLPIKVYASLIASVLRMRFELTQEEMIKIQCIAGWFYICQFTDIKEITGHDRTLNIVRILRAVGNHALPMQVIENLFEGMGMINSPIEMCDEIKTRVSGIHLENLNVGTLYDSLKMACFIGGPVAGRLYAFVGLEHPPTFLTILHETAINRGYSKTTIGMVIERYKKDLPSFIKAFNDYIGGASSIKEYNYEHWFM